MTSSNGAADLAAAAATSTVAPRLGNGIRIALFYLLLLIIALIFILPYLLSIFGAFKPLSAILSQSPRGRRRLPPGQLQDDLHPVRLRPVPGQHAARDRHPHRRAGDVLVMGAYAFARMEFPGRDSLFWVYLVTLMVPNIVTLVPLYVMFAHTTCSTPTGRSSCRTCWACRPRCS